MLYKCSRCKKMLDMTSFYKKLDKLTSRCKTCIKKENFIRKSKMSQTEKGILKERQKKYDANRNMSQRRKNNRESTKRGRIKLVSAYLATLFKTSVSEITVYPELMEAKKAQVLLYRKVKQKQ